MDSVAEVTQLQIENAISDQLTSFLAPIDYSPVVAIFNQSDFAADGERIRLERLPPMQRNIYPIVKQRDPRWRQ